MTKYCWVSGNSVDPDKMPHSVASFQDLHCLPMSVCQNTLSKYSNLMLDYFIQPSASVKNGLLLKLNMLSWLFACLDTDRDTDDTGEAGKQPKVKSVAPKPVFVILQQIAPMLQTIVTNWIMDAGVVEVWTLNESAKQNDPGHSISYKNAYQPSNDSDQPAG